MDAVNRQSRVHSLINPDHYFPTPSLINERDQQHSHTSISTPSAISPTSTYPNHAPPPYSHSIPPPMVAHAVSGMISPSLPKPPESRRTSGEVKDLASQRQSLPSIHEALYTPSPLTAPRSHVDASVARPYAAFPQPPPTPTSRANSIDGAPYQPQVGLTPQTSTPHPVHPSYSRADHMPPSPFENSRYPPLPSIRTALPAQSSVHPRPSPEFPIPEKDQRSIAPVSAGYRQHSPQHSHHPNHQNTPNTAPTSAYSPQSPYTPQRLYRSRHEYNSSEEQAKIGENPATQKVYGPVVKRHLDYWDIEIELNNMRSCGEEVSKLSTALLQDARNTNHSSMPERMPSLHDLDLIRVQQEKLANAIHRITEKVVAQGQYRGEQNGTTQGGKPAEEYPPQEELNWDDSRNIGTYGGPDAKKRRGRAAPPGRCHSCNRAETPEWRRGPDGARTLCNACGLHYAKLTRKLGSKNAQNGGSSLRPNSIGEVSPRS